MNRRTALHPEGFTLLEMIVVLAIIAIIAAFSVPRLTGGERREFNHAADQVADLLTMFAQRETLSRRPIGIGLDVGRRRLELYVLEGTGRSDGGSTWTRDALVRPMTIPDAIDLDALRLYVDDVPMSITDQPFGHAPGEPRPALRIDLQTISGAYRTGVLLASHAVAPRRLDGDDLDFALMPVDLDREGRSREDW